MLLMKFKIQQTLEKIFDVQVKQIYKELWPGCINNGSVYETDDHKVLFVKDNRQIGVIHNNNHYLLAYMNNREKKTGLFIGN